MSKRVYTVGARAQFDGITPFTWRGPATPGNMDIDAADGGVFGTHLSATFDLSHALSQAIGKQLPMCATYRVKGIQLRIANSTDGTNNNRGGMFYGRIKYISPNVHNIECIQAHRALEKATEESQLDADSLFLPTDDDYRGFRFGWYRESGVAHPTSTTTSDGVTHGNSIEEMWARYDNGVVTQHKESNNKLWISRCGGSNQIYWTTAMDVAPGDEGTVFSDMFDYHVNDGNHLDVLGGLLRVDVEGSAQEESFWDGSFVDDDFYLEMTVQVEGWTTW